MIDKRPLPTTERASTSFTRGGMSLLELLVAMAIVSVLAGLGFVSLPRDRFAAREVARVLAADTNRARSEAIRLNTNVALQFGGTACGGADYCLYTDLGRSGAPDADLDGDGTADVADPMLLRRTVAADFARVALTDSGFGSSGTIWFDVRGLPRNSTGAFLASTATAAARPAGGTGFLVTLEPQGRIQVTNE